MGSCSGRCVCGDYCSSSDDFCQNHSCDKSNGWKCGKEQKSWINNDKLFFKELKEGYQWQQFVGLFLKLNGLKVELTKLKIRSSIKEVCEWKNELDLIVNGHVLEVKSRNEVFTSSNDYPYSTAFIDTVSGFDAKQVKPLAYVIISRPTGSMLTIKSTTHKKWSVVSKRDRIRNIFEDFYVCEPRYLQSINLLISYLKNNYVCNK